MKALLFSGGMDSTVIAAWLRPDVLVTIDYGQRSAEGELRAASVIGERLGIRHVVIRVDCSDLGQGHLAGQKPSALGRAPEWWPYRNQLLITLCGMKLVPEGLKEIFIGTVAGDQVHLDGRSEFLQAMSHLMQFQEGHVRVSAPAFGKTTETLISEVPGCADLLPWTFSCHVASHACGQCRGCIKHQDVMLSVSKP